MKTCPLCTATDYPDNARTCPTHGLVLAEKQELAPGTMFAGSYRIERVLGRGGMGVVYLAEHVLLGEKHALKFLAPELAHDATFVQRFLREARRTRALRDPHVVEVHFMGQSEDGNFYIAMEYVDGPNLATVIEEHRQGLPVERALAIARGIAEGLAAAHAKGMVHRDIKPENVLLARDERGEDVAKITDFGLVTGTEEESRLTRTGRQMLTPDYAAPEQWKGVIPAHELDGRTDLYALGCVLFEMLTGRAPFDGPGLEQLREQHIAAPVPRPSVARRELLKWIGLDGLVTRLMAKEREQRPADVRAFLTLLDAMRLMKPARTNPEVVIPETVIAPPEPEKKTSRRPELHWGWLVGGGIAVVLALVLALPESRSWISHVWQQANAPGRDTTPPKTQDSGPLHLTWNLTEYSVRASPDDNETRLILWGNTVTEGYFKAFCTVVSGRRLMNGDYLYGSTPVVVLSSTPARKLFGSPLAAIGQKIYIREGSSKASSPATPYVVVGVADRKVPAIDPQGNHEDFWLSFQKYHHKIINPVEEFKDSLPTTKP